jgi:hypothetical protein
MMGVGIRRHLCSLEQPAARATPVRASTLAQLACHAAVA